MDVGLNNLDYIIKSNKLYLNPLVHVDYPKNPFSCSNKTDPIDWFMLQNDSMHITIMCIKLLNVMTNREKLILHLLFCYKAK